MSTYLDNLQWRYATKKFDSSKKLSREQLDELLSALRLSASSYGLQPYKFIVITDPDTRAKLREAAWDQSQITDASHLVVFAARKALDMAYVDHYLTMIAKERGMEIDQLKGFKDMLASPIQHMTPEDMEAWNKKQAYIALGFLLSAAAQMHVDACPMEGFDAARFDEILDLPKDGLTTAVICPLGFRAADDSAAQYKKVRFPKEELFDFRS